MSRKQEVAKEYIDNISQKDYFKNIQEIDQSLSIFKKNVEEGKITQKVKEDLQDFLVSENIFEGLGDDLLKKNFSTIALLSEEGKKDLDNAKSIINKSEDANQARKDLGLSSGPEKKENIVEKKNKKTLILGGKAKFRIEKFDENMVNLVIQDLEKSGITNPYVIKAILCTIGKESGFNVSRGEISYKNTGNGRIRRIFGSRVTGLSNKELNTLKSNDEAFWDRVYGPDDPTGKSQKYGNTDRGDGMKYRGRGLNGLTFKSNYQRYGDLIGEDLVANPELLGTPEVASKANAAYYKELFNHKVSKGKYNYSDVNEITDFDQALELAVHVTGGIGKDKNSRAVKHGIENAQENASYFILEEEDNMKMVA